MQRIFLAIDIGASSGRHIVGIEADGALQTDEVYRFPNGVQRETGISSGTSRAFSSTSRRASRQRLRSIRTSTACPSTLGRSITSC